jgi:hypothetical protein
MNLFSRSLYHTGVYEMISLQLASGRGGSRVLADVVPGGRSDTLDGGHGDGGGLNAGTSLHGRRRM